MPRGLKRRAPGTPPLALVADGRRRRAERSRERILEAVARALSDPDIVFTPENIAARAGVSISTIFRRFGDMDGLASAMRERIAARVMEHLAAGPFTGDVRSRVGELVRRRAAVYEIVGPLQRATLRQPRRRRGTQELHDHFKSVLRAQTTEALRTELARVPDLDGPVDTLLSLGAWLHMRVEQGLGADAAAAQVERGVLALLDASSRH
jgi:AcrR family transcriptional regulator